MDEMGNKREGNIRHAVPFVRQITEDGKPKLEVYRPTTNPIYIWTQVGQTNDANRVVMLIGHMWEMRNCSSIYSVYTRTVRG